MALGVKMNINEVIYSSDWHSALLEDNVSLGYIYPNDTKFISLKRYCNDTYLFLATNYDILVYNKIDFDNKSKKNSLLQAISEFADEQKDEENPSKVKKIAWKTVFSGLQLKFLINENVVFNKVKNTDQSIIDGVYSVSDTLRYNLSDENKNIVKLLSNKVINGKIDKESFRLELLNIYSNNLDLAKKKTIELIALGVIDRTNDLYEILIND